MSKEVNKSAKQKPSKVDRKVHRAVNKISKDVGPIFSKEPTNVSPIFFQKLKIQITSQKSKCKFFYQNLLKIMNMVVKNRIIGFFHERNRQQIDTNSKVGP